MQDKTLSWYRCTVNYVASNGLIRSSAMAIEAPNPDKARILAKEMANANGWKMPAVTKVTLYT